MKFRCFDIVNTGEPAPAEVIIELDDDEIEDDLDEAIHEALFESGEIDGHLESFEFEPMD